MSEPRCQPTARGVAARFLGRVLAHGAFPETLGGEPDFLALSPDDRGLCHELVLGTLRHLLRLDTILGRFCRRPLRHLDPLLQNTLRVAAYQILTLTRIPAYAAVNEGVREARAAGFKTQAGFVNAILRQVARLDDAAPASDAAPDTAAGLAALHSHPEFLLERWLRNYPLPDIRRWLERSNRPPDHYLAIQTARISPGDFTAECSRLGVTARPAPCVDGVLTVTGSLLPLEPLLARGLCFPQDLWSRAVVDVLPLRGYTEILDLCAGAGGKSLALALRFPDARRTAMDIHPGRLRSLGARAASLGLAGPRLLLGDARHPPLPPARFDLVLVDAPCSGTGTLQKNPDLRWRITPEDILRHARRQREILAAAGGLAAPGGILAYVTCSAEPEENQRVVDDFLQHHEREYAVVPPRGVSPEYRTPAGCFQSFPRATEGEGIFCAILEKKRQGKQNTELRG